MFVFFFFYTEQVLVSLKSHTSGYILQFIRHEDAALPPHTGSEAVYPKPPSRTPKEVRTGARFQF